MTSKLPSHQQIPEEWITICASLVVGYLRSCTCRFVGDGAGFVYAAGRRP